MAGKNNYQSITLYKDMAPQVLELTREEAGDIYQAIFRFSCYGEDTDFSKCDRFVRSLWETTKLKLQSGEIHDKQISNTNRENARKRWEKEKGSSEECVRIQSNATQCDRTTYTDTITGTNSPTTTISSTVTDTEQDRAVFDSVDRQAASAAAKAEPPAGDLFSAKQLEVIVTKNKVNLTQEGIKEFYDQMQDDRWTLYSKPVERKTILRALRAYAKHHPEYAPESAEEVEPKHATKEIIDTEILLEEKREILRAEQEETQRILSDPVAFEQWINEEFGEE